MENETYKNAKLILERFDPDSKKKMVSCLCSKLLGDFQYEGRLRIKSLFNNKSLFDNKTLFNNKSLFVV